VNQLFRKRFGIRLSCCEHNHWRIGHPAVAITQDRAGARGKPGLISQAYSGVWLYRYVRLILLKRFTVRLTVCTRTALPSARALSTQLLNFRPQKKYLLARELDLLSLLGGGGGG